MIEQLPAKWAQYLEPALFIGPALLMLTWALIVPTIRTLIASFYDQISKNFVGWQNYIYVFTNPNMRGVFRNNLLWLVFGTAFTVIAGLLIAVLAVSKVNLKTRQIYDIFANGDLVRGRRCYLEFCLCSTTS